MIKTTPRTGLRLALLALIALGAMALALPALSAAGKNTVELDGKLQGKEEIPGPGSKKGKGDVQVFLKPKKHKVCFELQVKNLDPMTAGHIHKGAEGVAGKIKVTLFEDQQGLAGDGSYEGCTVDVKKKLIKRMIKSPEKFYVNLHTLEFPDGAVRGQLAPTVGA